MTDKEKLLQVLDACDTESISDILHYYFELYVDRTDIRDIYDLSSVIDRYLGYKINRLGEMQFVANERARYIKRYLEGRMWPTEELAKKYLQPQIDNAQAIIDACNIY